MLAATATSHAPLEAASAARRPGPVVAATDGGDQCDAVVRIARVLAASHGAGVRVVSAVGLAAVPGSDLGIPMDPTPWNEARRSERRRAVEAQLDRAGAAADGWATEVGFGGVGMAAADAARSLGARVVVCPLGHHRLLDRMFGEEIALQAVRHADAPVLAVPVGMAELPGRAVIAVDFSPYSTRAALAALDVLAEGATAWLAHVLDPMERTALSLEGWGAVYARAVDEQCDRLRGTMRAVRPDLTVEVARLSGLPASALVEYAVEIGADLIAAGSHGYGFFERLVLGSTSTRLLRASPCAVLVVPPPYAIAEPAAWAERLRDFSTRHLGRRCLLEVDDVDFGAHVQSRGYPFLGAAYDPRDGRVEIMLGDGRAGGRHLTRSIVGARAVEVAPDENAGDVLHVFHGGGESRVSFPR